MKSIYILLFSIFPFKDVESKIPEALKLRFIHCRPEERYSVLLCLLKYIIPEKAQTVVFAGTQHHVELLSLVCFFFFWKILRHFF